MLMQEQIAPSDTCRANPKNSYTCSSNPLKVIAQRMRMEDMSVWVVVSVRVWCLALAVGCRLGNIR